MQLESEELMICGITNLCRDEKHLGTNPLQLVTKKYISKQKYLDIIWICVSEKL